MSADEREAEKPAEKAQGAELARGIARFAQYTSPVMLAMLASTGQNPALALTLPP